MASRAAAAIAVLALVCAAVHSSEGQLSPNFHAATCPDLERIVEFHVAETFRRDVGVAPALIRILFHDCFLQGCDASVLPGDAGSELNEIPNQTLRPVALDLIERIRAAVHRACGPTVSCADITVLATRDSLVKAGGPSFDVALGRRDGLAPASSALVGLLPAPFFDFATALRNKCAGDNPAGTLTQNLDVRTPDVFDNKYYFDLIARQGLFKSDQGLIDHPTTKRMATRFSLNQGAFFEQFARSMTKMSNMDILTGTKGEIRNNCAVPNRRVQDIETAVAGDEGIAADM
ncbi:hypothetical protein ZWY2020_011580 [Hordeum vulgare]|nr:hypothetical protein ZWY2020_011580 [Hordeum vulgare]